MASLPALKDVIPLMPEVVGAMGRFIEQRIHGGAAFQRDDAFVAAQVERLERWLAWFAPEVRGLEHLPTRGPYLCVGNHSGGLYTPCMWAFLSRWYRHLGLAPGFVPQLPLPSKITIEVGEPLDWHQRYGPEDAERPEVVGRCYAQITGTM
jgi:hypothetical protein